MTANEELAMTREWLQTHCHRPQVRDVLERGLAYVQAMERAGLTPETIDGDDLYAFLCDAEVEGARGRAFMQSTM
ncbi:MAG: hypothetical protein U1D55_17410 [Phycisphaerae bacterium]